MINRYLDGDTYKQIGDAYDLPGYKVQVILDRGFFEVIPIENRRDERRRINKIHWEKLMERRRARLGRLGSS